MTVPSGSGNNANERTSTETVAVVVVTHNSAEVLTPLLASIASSTNDALSEIIIVDNASNDDTVDRVRRSLPKASIMTNRENLGFARAANQGACAATSGLVLLANPDVNWVDGTLSRMAHFLVEHPNAAAVCPRLIHPDGRQQPSTRRFPTHLNIWVSRQSPLRFLRHVLPSRFSYTMVDPTGPTPVDAIAATFMLIRRDAFNAIGGMDEGYFLYVEDTDLCKRWHDTGHEVWIDPTVTVTHDWQGGSGRGRQLRIHHRDGIRRYFRTHHADQPIRNALLFACLNLADWWDRVGTRKDRERLP